MSAKWVHYTIRPGDSLTAVARRFGASVDEVARWNNLRNPNDIKVGQRLRLEKFVPGLRFAKPLRRMKVKASFRVNSDWQNPGLLLRTRKGEKVHAASPGRVTKVSYMRGYGTYILIDHGGGWITMYGNLKSVSVSQGQKVRANSVVAQAASDALFFLVARNGEPVNPQKYL